MFEEGPSALPKLTLTTVFDVSVSNCLCFLHSATSTFLSVEDKMRSDRLILQKKSLDKILGGKNSSFKQEEL